jgi:hypothetical protein
MLKKVISFVLGSSPSSTYPRRYASGLATDLFEYPPIEASYRSDTKVYLQTVGWRIRNN